MTDWLLDMILEALLLWMLVAAQLCKKDGTIIIIIILNILHEQKTNIAQSLYDMSRAG